MKILLAILFSYLFGSIPWGLVIEINPFNASNAMTRTPIGFPRTLPAFAPPSQRSTFFSESYSFFIRL